MSKKLEQNENEIVNAQNIRDIARDLMEEELSLLHSQDDFPQYSEPDQEKLIVQEIATLVEDVMLRVSPERLLEERWPDMQFVVSELDILEEEFLNNLLQDPVVKAIVARMKLLLYRVIACNDQYRDRAEDDYDRETAEHNYKIFLKEEKDLIEKIEIAERGNVVSYTKDEPENCNEDGI